MNSLANIKKCNLEQRENIDQLKEIEKAVREDLEGTESRFLFLDMKQMINNFLENTTSSKMVLDFEGLKSKTIHMIENIVYIAENIESVVNQRENTLQFTIEKIAEKSNILKRGTITIDSGINSLKESQNYLLETLTKKIGPSNGGIR